MDIILLTLYALLSIGSLVLFIVVLIKLFKTEGALKGILGIICGFYPFIWGWIKHKHLKLTKIMALWTGCMVIAILLQFFFLSGALHMVLNTLDPLIMPGPASRDVQKPVRRPALRPPVNKAVQKAPVKPTVPSERTTAKTLSPSSPNAAAQSDGVNYEFEMKAVNNLLNLNSENADALYNRGWLHEYKGDLVMAEKDYSEAIRINKRHPDAYYNRGLLFIKAKKYEEAIKDFSEAIKFKPRAFDAYCNRGNANFQLGKKDLAINDYSQALKINPNDADLYYNRAVVYLANGEKPKAMNDFQKAANLGHEEAREFLGK